MNLIAQTVSACLAAPDSATRLLDFPPASGTLYSEPVMTHPNGRHPRRPPLARLSSLQRNNHTRINQPGSPNPIAKIPSLREFFRIQSKFAARNPRINQRGVLAPLVPSFLRTGLRVPQDERGRAESVQLIPEFFVIQTPEITKRI